MYISEKYKTILGALKLIVTLFLIIFLLSKSNWNNVWLQVQKINLFVIVFVFFLMISSIAISSFKWRILLSIHEIHYSMKKLVKFYLIAMFFNNFLPTRVGGDAYRVSKTIHNQHSKAGAIIALFMERFTGICALLLLGFVGAIVGFIQHGNELSKWAVASGAIGIVIVISFFCIYKKVEIVSKLPEKFRNVINNVNYYKKNLPKLLNVILISFMFHGLSILRFVILIFAVEASCSFFDMALILTIFNIAGVLPITINGIGVVDGTFIYLINQYGVDYDAALLVMIVNRALLAIISFLGGLIYILDKKNIIKCPAKL